MSELFVKKVLREESKPDSVLIAISLKMIFVSFLPALVRLPAIFGTRVCASSVPFGGYNRWDCPFHSHSSLLLSNSVNSEFALDSYVSKEPKY